ncbi:MAG: hypothetical protein MSE26_04645 [Lachnospiraceae bacterium]|nr:hypothetical protein [Lachnospiraceae bacterium]
MDYNSAIQRHLGNISRQVGHDISKRYSYIVSQDDLTNAWLQMHNDLGYPLMMDSKYHRAIVYNKQGLEKQIAQMVNDCIIANIKELESMVAEDIGKDIESMLNGLVKAANGTVTLGKTSSRSGGSAINRFTSALVKGLVKGVGKIIDDMTNPKDDRRR